MATSKQNKPTESELEILRILWDKQAATVREVHELLSLHKDSGYTTTLKLMQIMFEKNLLARDNSSKVHIYKPNINFVKQPFILIVRCNSRHNFRKLMN